MQNAGVFEHNLLFDEILSFWCLAGQNGTVVIAYEFWTFPGFISHDLIVVDDVARWMLKERVMDFSVDVVKFGSHEGLLDEDLLAQVVGL